MLPDCAPGGGERHSLIWPYILGRAARKGINFGFFALNRVYNFMRTCPILACPKHGMFF